MPSFKHKPSGQTGWLQTLYEGGFALFHTASGAIFVVASSELQPIVETVSSESRKEPSPNQTA